MSAVMAYATLGQGRAEAAPLGHAVPSFPTLSEVWLCPLELWRADG